MKRYLCLFICICVFLCCSGCNVQAISELIHTSTPTVTSTPLPTSTPAPTKTPQPTATVYLIPTAVPDSQITMELQDDLFWLVTDHEGGYQFQILKTWYLDDVSEMEVMDILMQTQSYKEKLNLSMPPFMLIEPDGMRILGVYRDDAITDYMSMGFNCTYITDELVAVESLEEFSLLTLNVLVDNYGLTEEDVGVATATNKNGVEVTTIIFNLALDHYQMKILFELENGFGMITYGFSDRNFEVLKIDLGTIMNSLQLIDVEMAE